LTSVAMKSIERLVMVHINTIIPETLNPLQFAYRQNRSTDDAISIALHTALSHLDKRNTYVRMLFIDYSSAFNTIVPSKFITKRRILGLNTSLCNWILDPGRPQILKKFYRCNTASLLGMAIARPPTARHYRGYITGAKLPAIQDLYTRRCQWKALKIVKDPGHPSHRLLSQLPHGKRYRSAKSRTKRLLNSFYPQTIRLLNSPLVLHTKDRQSSSTVGLWLKSIVPLLSLNQWAGGARLQNAAGLAQAN
ncbi:unnamed protein product, partial [Oncorhynchus mykiss]